ncbi:MAG: hypothetical protein ACNA75_04325 [Thiohalomonadaceae bacterium]
MELDGATLDRIDEALRVWRQGDCVLGEHWLLFRLDVGAPITEEARVAAAEGADAGEAEVRGLMLLTQTCDIVRSCRDRPFVEVCPLVEVDDEKFEEIRKGRRPNYAYIPGIGDGTRLVGDLDRLMAVEKAVVAGWNRLNGCRDDDEVRRLSLALARKRARFAFPDDFVAFVKDLQSRLTSKHNKHSDEGRALRALREIRVRAAPSWELSKSNLRSGLSGMMMSLSSKGRLGIIILRVGWYASATMGVSFPLMERL